MSERVVIERFSCSHRNMILPRLEMIGALYIGTVLFRAISFTPPTSDIVSSRLIDDGFQITIVEQKRIGDSLIEETREIKDFNEAVKDLTFSKYKKWSHIEKIREIYEFENSRILFECLPALPPFLVLESFSEEKSSSLKLILNLKEEPFFSSSDLYYKYYGVPLDTQLMYLEFSHTVVYLNRFIQKNISYFLNFLMQQRAVIYSIKKNSSKSLKIPVF
jgi:hypothetical protein